MTSNPSILPPPGKSAPLRLALDVSALNARPSGIGHYALNLAAALKALDNGLQMHLVSHQDLHRYPQLAPFCGRQPHGFPVRALWMQLRLPGILNSIGPDLCHFTNSLAPLAMRHPYVVSIHDMSLSLFPSYHKFPKRYYSRLLIPTVARRAAAVITDSARSRADIERLLGIPKARIHAIPLAAASRFHPVGPEPFLRQFLSRYGLSGPYMIFVGTLEPRKNLRRLLHAFARLSPDYREHTLVLVGQMGWQLSDLQGLIDQLSIRQRVRLLGYVPDEDLPALYSGAAFALYPSLLEGFGLPVLEAMSCGTPVLTSSGSGLEEVAGEAAHIVDPLEVDSIAAGMRHLLDNRELRLHLSTLGLRRAVLFSWQETARRTCEVYRRALECADPSRDRPAFRLRVELDPPANPRLPPHYGEQGPLNESEWAVLKTVVYASLFRYPLTAEETSRRLFDRTLSAREIDRILETSGPLAKLLESSEGFIHLRGGHTDVPLRKQREAATISELHRERHSLQLLCRMPWVRMVAFSGATAHSNMDAGDDLDLFLVVRTERLWLFFLAFTVLAKLAGKRRKLCVNYVVSEARLAMGLADFFSADQLLSLKPLCGKAWHGEILRQNPWIDDFFPGRRQMLLAAETAARPEPPARAGGLLAGLDRLCLRIYGSYLLRKARHSKADIDLGPLQIKVHLKSHRPEVGARFQQRIDELLSAS